MSTNRLWGVPDGPDLAGVRWEMREEGAAPRRIFSEVAVDGFSFRMSCNRPLVGADQTVRYDYIYFTRP